jgi:hypothetical protein
MHGPINVISPNNISKWQIGFNSAFKGLMIKFKEKNTNHIIINLELHLRWIKTIYVVSGYSEVHRRSIIVKK